jgi:hypothetical protein
MGTRRHIGVCLSLALGLAAVFIAGAVPDAEASRRGRRSNMPAGWSWPPTPSMVRAGERCLEALTRARVEWRAAPRTRAVVTPIVVPAMELGGVRLTPTYRRGPFVMDCQLALALAEHGEVFRQLGIRELRFSTIHEYRRIRVRGRASRALSRHALGLAIDVFEMVTDEGERLVVKDRYRRGDQTLRAVERGIAASLAFRTPLTPGNSPRSHGDHFHLEARVSYTEDRTRSAALVRPGGARAR